MNETVSLLSQIHEPADLRKLSSNELSLLAVEIRELIISRVSRNGGHLASNLGVVELSIALHRVFNSPSDKIVWDVGHQCYTHKLLTGRYEEFSTLRQSGGLSGFPKPAESPHDPFATGHASTSISAALGLLAGDRIKEGKNRVVAVIGDGALTGGLAYEGLSHAGQMGLPLVVILNDNKMSISPNVGGISKYLSHLSMKSHYQLFRRTFDSMVKRIPIFGERLFDAILRLKRAVKAVFYIDNFFVDLGFEYVGPIQGHNIRGLEDVLRDVRELDRPVVVHVITRKGKGYHYAENDPGRYHGVSSFSVPDGIPDKLPGFIASGPPPPESSPAGETAGRNTAGRRPLICGNATFTDAFCRAMLDAGARDKRVMAITAAMDKGIGLSPFKAAYPARFFDVGIAEEHAVTFAAGLAAQGLRPVVAVYSTFMQRAVDQVIHDVAIQKLPVTFALDRAGFVGDDGETHQGLFDIALFRSVPNMSILAPAGAGELIRMVDWALSSAGPAMLRYPKAPCPPESRAFSLPLEPGRGVFIREWGASLCLAFTGSLYAEVWDAADRLKDADVATDLYNLRFLHPVDEDYLADILNHYEMVVVIEEGMKRGGFGEYVAELALRRRCKARLLTLGVPGYFIPQGKREELLRLTGLDGAGIARSVLQAWRKDLKEERTKKERPYIMEAIR